VVPGLFFLVLAGFVVAMEIGMGPGPSRGSWVAAYVATEATKPIRIVITLALTRSSPRWPTAARPEARAVVVDTQEVDAK
jgi:hypothetical protein